MSLGPTFVETKEGNWYENPVIRRSDWFICWDEDEPIELVIAEGTAKFEDILFELKQAGWTLKPYGKGKGRRSERVFNGKFRPAVAYFLEQTSPPTDALMQGNKPGTDHPWAREGTYYPADPNAPLP